jgi:ankyrin repeat protein
MCQLTVDYESRTPLHAASEGGHTELGELLLRKGANINDRGARQNQVD